MKHKITTWMIMIAIILSVPGCKLFSADLKPTVDNLRETIKDMRERDYEKGRVVFSSTASVQSKVLLGRIERMMDAENNAAVALDEPTPHKDVSAKAAKKVAEAMKERP